MARIIVIADDLTGANATCSLIRKTGLSTASILSLREEAIPKDVDALAIPTNSRAVEPQEAYRRVRAALRVLKSEGVDIYNKRTDSTLRGNLGPEIKACLDELGDGRMAIAVPAYPNTGRVVVKETMLVNGELLVNSDAGHDAKAPVDTSNTTELLTRGFQGSYSVFGLDVVEEGPAAVAGVLRAEQAKGTRMVIFDAFSNDHIQNLAQGTMASGVSYLAVDPGPFTQALTREMLDLEVKLSRILMIVGSVTDITMQQLDVVIQDLDPYVVKVDAYHLIDQAQHEEEIRRAVECALEDGKGSELVLITSSPIGGGERLDLMAVSQEFGLSVDEASAQIADGLAKVGKKVLVSEKEFSGIFVSGGDITVSLCDVSQSVGVEILSEIVPLAAYGRVIGGELDNVRIISKGGMVGDDDTMRYCVQKLRGESV